MIKEDQNFNRRNIFNILRAKIFIWLRDWRKRQFSFEHEVILWQLTLLHPGNCRTSVKQNWLCVNPKDNTRYCGCFSPSPLKNIIALWSIICLSPFAAFRIWGCSLWEFYHAKLIWWINRSGDSIVRRKDLSRNLTSFLEWKELWRFTLYKMNHINRQMKDA